MRVVFAGTPEFAQAALERLHAANFAVPLVLTQPDRPAGRGMKLQASPVKAWAAAHGIAVAQPRSLRLDGKFPADAEAARLALHDARPDVLVVAAYGLILPTFQMKQNAVERWRMVHAGVRDTIRLIFTRALTQPDLKPGKNFTAEDQEAWINTTCGQATLPYTMIAADGLTMAQAQTARSFTLQPGYRYDALLQFVPEMLAPRQSQFATADAL